MMKLRPKQSELFSFIDIMKYRYYNLKIDYYSKKIDKYLEKGDMIKTKKWLKKKLLLAPKMRELLEKRK